MNLDIFKPNNEDGAFLAYIKREALSIINTNIADDSKQYWYDYYKALMELCKASYKSVIKDSYQFISNIVQTKDYLKYHIPLCPINITKEDFEIINNETLYRHKRSFDLIWNSTHNLTDEKSIYYRNAYNLQIRKVFDFIKKEVTNTDYHNSQCTIFISKGGVINGDFIYFVFIHTKDYKKGDLELNLPITIPVCKVYFKDKNNTKSFIYAVDHREPALKELMEKYNCSICNNTDIASYKLNLRACKAESKARKDYTLITFDKPEICKRGNYEVIEKDGAVYLNCLLGTIAKWKDGHLTIYWNKCRYKKVNSSYWEWFTKHNLQHLKTIYKNNNNNITFIY